MVDTARKMNIKGDFTGDFPFFFVEKKPKKGPFAEGAKLDERGKPKGQKEGPSEMISLLGSLSLLNLAAFYSIAQVRNPP